MKRGWIFNQLGNLFFRLNGGLDRLHNKSLLDRLATWSWAISYGYYDRWS